MTVTVTDAAEAPIQLSILDLAVVGRGKPPGVCASVTAGAGCPGPPWPERNGRHRSPGRLIEAQ